MLLPLLLFCCFLLNYALLECLFLLTLTSLWVQKKTFILRSEALKALKASLTSTPMSVRHAQIVRVIHQGLWPLKQVSLYGSKGVKPL